MVTTAAPLTAEEFLALPDKPGYRLELLEGSILELRWPPFGDDAVKARITEKLVAHTAEKDIRVFVGACFILSERDVYAPDVSCLSNERVRRADPNDWFRGAPELAIEVVTYESASDLELKVHNYFRHGTLTVWAAYRDLRVVRTYHPGGGSQIFEDSEVLREPGLLPGFEVPVSRFFRPL